MHGCSSKQVGGAKLEVHIPPNASKEAIAMIQGGSTAVVNAKNFPAKPEPYNFSSTQNFAAVGGNTAQSGGYKSKHRRHRYKKSIGRRGRSRRCKDSCK